MTERSGATLVIVLCVAGLWATLWWARVAARRERALRSRDREDTARMIESLRRYR